MTCSDISANLRDYTDNFITLFTTLNDQNCKKARTKIISIQTLKICKIYEYTLLLQSFFIPQAAPEAAVLAVQWGGQAQILHKRPTVECRLNAA